MGDVAEGERFKHFSTVEEFHDEAQKRLPARTWKYYMHGAGERQTLEENCTAFRDYYLRPRVMTNVETRDTGVTLLGEQKISVPMCLSPVTLQSHACPDGECSTARAAQNMNTVMMVSTWASKGIDEVAEAAPDAIKWFQCHPFYERDLTVRTLVKRAEKAGYKAVVLTIDSRVLGREFAVALQNGEFNFGKLTDLPNLKEFGAIKYHDPSSTWEFLDWLKGITSLPVVVKGILTAEGAEEAIHHGADAIIVSNQGARHLDCVVPSIDALPDVVQAVAGRCDVYMDGGIRKGSDVFKALALGAKAVFVGRPLLWGLTCGGSEGVEKVFQILKEQLDVTMGLCGCASIEDIEPSLIVRRAILKHPI